MIIKNNHNLEGIEYLVYFKLVIILDLIVSMVNEQQSIINRYLYNIFITIIIKK
jgi:hypothetical protein